MSGIAGLVYGDPRRPIGAGVMPALIARAPIGTRPVNLDGPGSLLLGLSDAHAERLVDAQVVAALDHELPSTMSARTKGAAIRQLYEEFGPVFPAQLRGAFSIALWLPVPRTLVVAVDHFGLARIYYAVGSTGLAFSSRVRGPLALEGTTSEIEPDAIYAYLNLGTVPAPQTPYRAVRRLPPGHVLIWRDGEVSLQPYWEMVYEERRRGEREAAVELRRQTEGAVQRALRHLETKETGAFLSGGTDSSTIVGFMSRLAGERVNAFSIGFAEERYNELGYAELAARHFGVAHYARVIGADEALEAVPGLVRAYDEPFGNDSVIPTYLCAQMARDAGMQCLLAGDGGDEIFGGNERYRREQILARYTRIPRPLRRGLLEPILNQLPDGGASYLGKAQRYVWRAAQPNPDRFYTSEFFFLQERARFLHPDFLASVRADWPLEVARGHFRNVHAGSDLNRLMHVDLKLTLGDNDLFKVNRSAELAGVKVRFPLLDSSLVEFTGTLATQDKVRGTEKRYLFKRAFATLLPQEILTKRKHGFGLPVSGWLKTHSGFRSLAQDTLLSKQSAERGYFSRGALEELFRLHAADDTPYYGGLLWICLMLELWHKEHAPR